MNRYLAVATTEELKLPKAQYLVGEKGFKPIVTGVGPINVFIALRSIPREAQIVNVGYCGAVGLPIGYLAEVGNVRSLHPSVNYDEPEWNLSPKGIPCRTSMDFVTSPAGLPSPCVVDMELAAICACGFKSVAAYKYVSDNLNIEQYNETIKGQQ